eukprot:51926_1
MSDFLIPYVILFAIFAALTVSLDIYGIVSMRKEMKTEIDSSLNSNYIFYYNSLSILTFLTNAIFSVVVLITYVWLYIAYDDYSRDFTDYDNFPLMCLHMYLWHFSKIFILWLCNARLFYTFNGMGADMQISYNFYITMNILSTVLMLVLCSISVYGYAATTSPYLRRVGMDGSRFVFAVVMICFLVLFNKRLYLKTNQRKTVRMHHMVNLADMLQPEIGNETDMEMTEKNTKETPQISHTSITDEDYMFIRSATGRDYNTFAIDSGGNFDDIYVLLDVITRYSILVTIWCITMISLIIVWDIIFVMDMKGEYFGFCYWQWTAIVDSFCVLCLYEPNTERIDCYKLWFKCNDDTQCKSYGLAIHYWLDKICVNCAKKYGGKKKK